MLAAGAAMAALPANAHGIWFASRAKQPALIYGVGADDLDIVERRPLVEKIAAYDASYQPIPAALRVSGPVLYIDADSPPTLLTATLNNGTWSRTKDGTFVRKGRDEVPDATLFEKTLKYAVSIQGPLSAPIPPLLDQALQIVPAGALPATLGSPFTYRVLFLGKPVAGARMINDMVNDLDARARMKAGDALLFRWHATGPVKMDMHGEPGPPSTDFTTYWKEKGLRSAQGSFTGPSPAITAGTGATRAKRR